MSSYALPCSTIKTIDVEHQLEKRNLNVVIQDSNYVVSADTNVESFVKQSVKNHAEQIDKKIQYRKYLKQKLTQRKEKNSSS